MKISDNTVKEIPGTLIINSGSARLNVRIYRRNSAESVILLHGGPGVPDEMTEVREFLSDHLQVIVFDQRGTGESNDCHCSFTIREYIEDINTIAAFLKLDSFYLFGHSWGGLYAQLFARDYPLKVAGLFLCSPGPGTGKAWVEAEREVFIYNWRLSTLVEFAFMALNSILAFFGSSAAYKRLFRQLIINYHKGYNVPPPELEKLEKINSHASKKTRKEIRNYPEIPDFGQTAYPVVITYGQYDAYGNSKRYITKRFPFSPVIIIPQCGHTPWKHNWPAFQPILSNFFLSKHPDGVPPPRRGV